METTENEHRKFELNALRYRQPVQFHEHWRYVLVLPFGVIFRRNIPTGSGTLNWGKNRDIWLWGR